jgi:putative oxidoreductase
MVATLLPWMHLIGRILFVLVFLDSGRQHLANRASMAQYAGAKSIPAPGAAVVLSGLWIIVGGLFVALGWNRFIGAAMLAVFLLPTAFLMHAFWKETDPQTRMMERVHFLKDLALLGATLVMAYHAGDPWPFSLEP